MLESAAGLNLIGLLVGEVGGLGSLFNLLVVPDIRCYKRIVVFIAPFSLLAVGFTAIRAGVALRRRTRLGPRVLGATVLGVMVLGVFDQAATRELVERHPLEAARFAGDRRFVADVEGSLPPGAMIFHLPHTEVPVDPGEHDMGVYEQPRAYLHSRKLRWSWGTISGRQRNWNRSAGTLAPRELVERLALAGLLGDMDRSTRVPRPRPRGGAPHGSGAQTGAGEKERVIVLRATLRAGSAEPRDLEIACGRFDDTITVTNTGYVYERQLRVGPGETLAVDFSVRGTRLASADDGLESFAVVDLSINDVLDQRTRAFE